MTKQIVQYHTNWISMFLEPKSIFFSFFNSFSPTVYKHQWNISKTIVSILNNFFFKFLINILSWPSAGTKSCSPHSSTTRSCCPHSALVIEQLLFIKVLVFPLQQLKVEVLFVDHLHNYNRLVHLLPLGSLDDRLPTWPNFLFTT